MSVGLLAAAPPSSLGSRDVAEDVTERANDLGTTGSRKGRATVKIGRRKTQGFCNKADIKSVLAARVEALKACYEAGLDEHPDLGGKLVASWVIRMEGDTRTLRVPTNALGEGPTTQCITRVLSRMRFKPPKGGVCLVEQSFTFSARP
jgi:hypothetical protein